MTAHQLLAQLYELGARVSLVRGRSGGRIIIGFHNDEELDGILERIRR